MRVQEFVQKVLFNNIVSISFNSLVFLLCFFFFFYLGEQRGKR